MLEGTRVLQLGKSLPYLIVVIKDAGDWMHALHELVREKGEFRDGRLLAVASTTAAKSASTAPAAAATAS